MRKTLETLAALLPATLAIVSCETLGDRLNDSGPRWEVTHPGHSDPNDKPTPADTSVYISAVVAPDGYDWRRDSAWDTASYRIVVLKNGEQILSVPADRANGISADPDLHHLIEGRLYTECSDRTSTTIALDGEAVCRWEGREILVGLMERNDGLWTLGRNRSGHGFSLRKDGKVMLTKENGIALGGFHANGYGSNGALYEDEGHLCFCYRTNIDGMESLFAVVDGAERLVSTSCATTTLDARMIGGSVCTLYNQGKNTYLNYREDTLNYGCTDYMMWKEAGIVRYKGEICAAGQYWVFMYAGWSCGVGWETNYEALEMTEGEVFTDGDYADCFCPWMSEGTLLSRSCAAFLDGRMIVALNPQDATSLPYLWSRDGIVEEFDMNGFLTGLEVVVSPAR